MNFLNNGLQPQVPSFFNPWKTLVRQRYIQFLRTTIKMESCKERIKCTLKQQNRCRIIRKSIKIIHKPLFKTQNSSAFQELHFFYVLLSPYNDLRKYFSVRSLLNEICSSTKSSNVTFLLFFGYFSAKITSFGIARTLSVLFRVF